MVDILFFFHFWLAFAVRGGVVFCQVAVAQLVCKTADRFRVCRVGILCLLFALTAPKWVHLVTNVPPRCCCCWCCWHHGLPLCSLMVLLHVPRNDL